MIQLCVLDVNLRGQVRFNPAATEMKMWNGINTNGPLIRAFGGIHLDRCWRVDLNDLLRSQWSTINGFNCCGQTAELGQVWSCLHWFSQNGWFSQRAPWEDGILARYYCFSHEAPHMLKPVGNSDNFNCYLPIGLLCIIYEQQEMCYSSSCVSATCPASTGHQHVWPHWNTNWNAQRIPLWCYIRVQLHVGEMRHARQQKLQDLSQPGALLPSSPLSPSSLRHWLPCVHVCACEGRLCACQHVCMSSYKSCSQQTTAEKM